ncbi:MAG: EAL domain-containing protein [Cyanobacteria bacterium P01_D01_bin.128]
MSLIREPMQFFSQGTVNFMSSQDRPQAALKAPRQADILIVDDTIENVLLLAQILEAQNYRVRKAISGQMARMAINAAPPDLILLDICMPELDGYELCRQLKANAATAHIPVVFLSALNNPNDKVKAFEAGGADYITKPFQSAEVLLRTRNQLMIQQAWRMMRSVNQQLEVQVKARTAELEIANQKLSEIAFQDKLTGLPNRAALMAQLSRTLETVRANPDHRLAVLFFDCDRFKLVNDSFGHLVGDDVLVQVAQRLRQCVDNTHLLTRFGGDEFVLVLNAGATRDQAIAVAQQAISAMQPGIPLAHGEVFIGVSVGIVLSSPIQHRKPEHILRDADIAMYNAKANGKGCYSLFNPLMQQASAELLQLETDLHRAVDNCEFLPFYQPIVDLKTGTIVGAEVLARWQHPKRGLLMPHRFLSVAEEAGLLIPVGRQLLRLACQQLALWRRAGTVSENFYISFNLSVSELTQVNSSQSLSSVLASYGLTPAQLRIEITETALLDQALTEETMTTLTQEGFKFCIDDFGVGYSAFSYLHQFPVEVLKIDRSFIQNIRPDTRDYQIVKAILSVVENLDMVAVAEGIETFEQRRLLTELGCALGQGYLFSRPCAAADMRQALSCPV